MNCNYWHTLDFGFPARRRREEKPIFYDYPYVISSAFGGRDNINIACPDGYILMVSHSHNFNKKRFFVQLFSEFHLGTPDNAPLPRQ